MSEMAPEGAGGGGNILSRPFFGIPGWLWLGGAAVLVYLYLRNKNSSSSSSSTGLPSGAESPTGGSGTITTGATTIDSGAVRITVSAPNNIGNTPPSPTTKNSVLVPTISQGETAGTAHNAIQAAGLIPRDAQGAVPGEFDWPVESLVPNSGSSVPKGSDVDIIAQKPGT